MPRASRVQGFKRAMDEAKQQASDVSDAATAAARRTVDSFEAALRDVVESKPYTAVGIALAIGWFLGRMHRPL